MKDSKVTPLSALLMVAATPVAIIVLICVIIPMLVWITYERLSQSSRLVMLVRNLWGPQGIKGLVVASNHRLWSGWVSDVLTRYERSLVYLDWSDKDSWETDHGTLDVEVYKHWVRENGYTKKKRKSGKRSAGMYPVIIVFSPWWWPQIIDLRQAFISLSHGDHLPLLKERARLQSLLD